MRRLLLLTGLVCVLIAGAARAQQERIVSFDADITVRADGSLYVEETIDVIAGGQQIKRGIFRDIPTRSIVGFGLNHIAGFKIEKIERDGIPEPHFVRKMAAGLRIYIGRQDRWITAGAHRYVIGYTTTQQLHYHDDADELYWNVTGNEWDFPIDRATATIRLPGGMTPKSITGYTGTTGPKGADYQVLQSDSSTIRLESTRGFWPGEGLTVAVFWPRGAVERPGFLTRTTDLLSDNRGPFFGLILFIAMSIYFYILWQRIGRDPEPGPVIARYHPPEGLSPVAVGFVEHGGFDYRFSPGRAFAVALTSLATKGAIRIEENGKDEFTLHRGQNVPADLPRGEKAVFDFLTRDDAFGITFGEEYEPAIANARWALRGAFDSEYGELYLRKNRRQWFGGAMIGVAAILTSMLSGPIDEETFGATAFMVLFGAAFFIPAAWALTRVFAHLRTAVHAGNAGRIIGSVLVGVITIVMLAPVAGVNFYLFNVLAPISMVVSLASVAVATGFWFWLSAPTHLGRKTYDEIAGYKLYLSVAEADRLNAAGEEPAITAALFERHLPYAMALGVEHEWTRKFESYLAASMTDRSDSQSRYEPDWYSSSSRRSRGFDWKSIGSLSNSLSNGLSDATITAATRQSSGSGGSGGGFSGGSFGGGGFSGGGGGGGGGGGW